MGPGDIDHRARTHFLLGIVEVQKAFALENEVTFLGIMMVRRKRGTGLKFQYAETEAVGLRFGSINQEFVLKAGILL